MIDKTTEDRVRDLEEWKRTTAKVEIERAKVEAEREKALEKRFSGLSREIKTILEGQKLINTYAGRIVWLILASIISTAMAFLNGGVTP